MLKKILKVMILIIIYANPTFTQVSWERTYGKGVAYCIRKTKDVGYIVVGNIYKKKPLFPNIFLMKIDESGDTLWVREIGEDSIYNNGQYVDQTKDNSYIITGSEADKAFLLKVDSEGNEILKKKYPAVHGNYIKQTIDGGYIIIGSVFVLKTDRYGEQQWLKHFDGDFIYSGMQTSDEGYILLVFEVDSYYLFKVNKTGNLSWKRKIQENNGVIGCLSIKETSDKGYIISGCHAYKGATEGEHNLYIIKTNSLGQVMWRKSYGERFTRRTGLDIIENSDGGFSVTGFYYTFGKDNYLFLLKTDCAGEILWERIYERDLSSTGYCIQHTGDGGYILAGGKSSKIYIVKTDNYGRIKGKFVIKIDDFLLNHNYPNPFNSSTTIRYELKKDCYINIKIYDVLGREIRTLENKEMKTGEYKTVWDGIDSNGKEVPSGVYFCKLKVEGALMGKTVKLVLIR